MRRILKEMGNAPLRVDVTTDTGLISKFSYTNFPCVRDITPSPLPEQSSLGMIFYPGYLRMRDSDPVNGHA
jgi:hypothetical protein